MKKLIITSIIHLLPLVAICQRIQQSPGEMIIKMSNDFTITGAGSAKNWDITEWTVIPMRSGAG